VLVRSFGRKLPVSTFTGTFAISKSLVTFPLTPELLPRRNQADHWCDLTLLTIGK
jgi:hypothetical protein